MIKSFGLFWTTDEVFWGRQRNPGALWGARSTSAKSVAIDFREQRGIYALYADYTLVYVGQTGSQDARLLNRLRAHRSDHLAERWDRFSWFGTQWVKRNHTLSTDAVGIQEKIRAALNVLEAVSIAIAEPRLNLQRGRWGKAGQYFQVRDTRLDEGI